MVRELPPAGHPTGAAADSATERRRKAVALAQLGSSESVRRQAALAFATWVAIASISAGERQSYGSSPSSLRRDRMPSISDGLTPDSITEDTNAAKPGQILRIPIAHNDGNYHADEATLAPARRASACHR